MQDVVDMKFLILITAYNRIDYIKQLIESIRLHKQDRHEYQIVVNDDGSKDGTREWLESQSDIHTLYSDNRQIHHADNNLILYANSQQYDFGFKMDDDLVITKRGWEDIYYNTYLKTGYAHLVHHSHSWSNPDHITPSTCQGAFWTFTPEALANIGFMDSRIFGRRGWGHGDFTARACRMGYNREQGLIDAENSNEYIKLHTDNYQFTPGYDAELQLAMLDKDFKSQVLLNPNRLYVPLPTSILNHFFDHIYVLNLSRRKDRRKRMEHELTRHGVYDFEFWTATEHKEGWRGCAMSHISIYEDIKAKGYRRPLILEDDVIFIRDLHKSLISLYDVPNDWMFLYLGASDYNHMWCEVKEPYYRGNYIDGTFAYAINGLMIDEVIHYTSKARFQSIPIDTRLHTLHNKYPSYIIHPMTCIADLTGSDIRPDRDTEQHAKLINWDLKLYR